jgi:hypothetical protein
MFRGANAPCRAAIIDVAKILRTRYRKAIARIFPFRPWHQKLFRREPQYFENPARSRSCGFFVWRLPSTSTFLLTLRSSVSGNSTVSRLRQPAISLPHRTIWCVGWIAKLDIALKLRGAAK